MLPSPSLDAHGENRGMLHFVQHDLGVSARRGAGGEAMTGSRAGRPCYLGFRTPNEVLSGLPLELESNSIR
jgi:hypothetical protein